MKKNIKEVTYRSLTNLGITKFFRTLNRKKAVVLTYHGVVRKLQEDLSIYEYRNFVQEDVFEQQIQFLLKHYRPLKIKDFFDHQDITGGFYITFDDGFYNNYRYAFPILKKYGLQASFFVTTSLIDSKKMIWTEEITRYIKRTHKKSLSISLEEERVFPLTSDTEKEKASFEIRMYLKSQEPEIRAQLIKDLSSQLDDVPEQLTAEEEDRYLFMTWEQLKEMLENGQDIGSHTHTHPILSTISPEESFQEFKISKELIENRLNTTCFSISYPNGTRADFNLLHEKQVAELGYKCAFTQMPSFNTTKTDRFALRRINISYYMTMPIFEAILAGVGIVKQ